MVTRKKTTVSPVTDVPALDVANAVQSVKHRAKRKNIPPAGLEAQGRVEEAQRVRHEYNPHLPPRLKFADDPAAADRLPALLATARKRALNEDEARELAEALRRHEPWLEWSGKRERPWFEVEPPALHIHERVSTQAMLRVLAREDVNRDLFADPQQTYAEAVQFYRHDVDWANRMILGDSLAVMASLSRREDLMGKVQMIYIDPPYGISFKSNFQPQLGQLDVKDKVQDLTREPEMVKAYRDTWTLGVHSYLAYLRDRLAMARELLADSGSVFVQISDENLHRVRAIMDEVFGPSNFVCQLSAQKTGTQTGEFLVQNSDFVLWFARDRPLAAQRYNQLFLDRQTERLREDFGGTNQWAADPLTSDGFRETTTKEFEFEGGSFHPGANRHWGVDLPGLLRASKADRVVRLESQIRFKKLLTDFPVTPLGPTWTDVGGATAKVYVVQTAPKVIERCLLMTTDPGDLVLDPTCGSGTTAFVAEKWGRRWITCDTSRVALALAKQRLMTATFEHHKLRPLSPEDLQRNPRGAWLRNGGAVPMTFDYKTVPHITLKSIARNTALDAIFARHEPTLAARLDALNVELTKVTSALMDKLVEKLVRKHREEGTSAVTEADQRRWLLPGAQPGLIREGRVAKPLKALTAKQAQAYREAIPKGPWQPWQVPFDTDTDWPTVLQAALTAYRTA